jgi:hypothetical protein
VTVEDIRDVRQFCVITDRDEVARHDVPRLQSMRFRVLSRQRIGVRKIEEPPLRPALSFGADLYTVQQVTTMPMISPLSVKTGTPLICFSTIIAAISGTDVEGPTVIWRHDILRFHRRTSADNSDANKPTFPHSRLRALNGRREDIDQSTDQHHVTARKWQTGLLPSSLQLSERLIGPCTGTRPSFAATTTLRCSGANLMANREILPKHDWAGRNNLSRPLFDLHQTVRAAFPQAYPSVKEANAVTDFCYSRPTLNQVLRRAALMDSVMQRVGADHDAARALDGGTAWFEARVKCISCSSERQCLEWLMRSQPAAYSVPSQFCLNAAYFRRCRDGLAIDAPPSQASGSIRP